MTHTFFTKTKDADSYGVFCYNKGMDVKQYLATNKRPPKNKFGNIKTEFNGQIFDSKLEASYALLLETMKKASNSKDKVLSYQTQVPYKIVFNGIPICTYYADFKVQYADGREEVIDTKPLRKNTGKYISTDVYKLKKKLVFAQYGVTIIEKSV